METEQAPLATEDYQALHAMLLSGDPSVRAQGQGLAKKLTPDEQQTFFDVQKTANAGKGERTREDNSLLGMPPEFAALSGMAIGRAVGAPALTAAGRAVAGIKAVAGQALPQVKYEVTKSALQSMGISPALAIPVALMASGYRKGAPAATAEPAAPTGPNINGVSVDELRAAGVGEHAINATLNGRTVVPPSPAVPVEPVAAGPAAPAVPAAPVTPAAAPPPPAASAPSPVAAPPASPLPDQKSLNEAALAVRRAAYQARMSSAPPVEAAPAPVAGNVKLSAAETKAFLNLMQRGMPGPEAMKNVLMQRSLVESLGTPTPTAAETRFPKGMRGKSTP